MERLLERTDILDMMGSLKLFGMRSAFDEIVTTAVKRQHEPQRLVGDLLKAEIDEKLASSIKYQMTIARLPLAKDVADFTFADTPINEMLVHDLAGGHFIAEQRNCVLVAAPARARRTSPSRSPAAASAPDREGASSTRSTSSTGSRPRPAPAARDVSPIISPAWTSSSSTSSGICPSRNRAASFCST